MGDTNYYGLNRNIFLETGQLALQYRGLTMPVWGTGGRPSAPREGEFGFNAEAQQLEIWDGDSWVLIT
jgi:hypothetical protein